MKTPTWATVTGILMIVFGGCSVMNDIKSITLPSILEKQKSFMEEKMKEAKAHEMEEDSIAMANTPADSLAKAEGDHNEGEDEDVKESFEEKEKKVEEALKLPEFSKIWIVRFGYVGLVSAVLYAIGGIFLLVKRPFSIKLAYTVLGISIVTSAVQAAVLVSGQSSGIIALSTGLSQLVGVLVDIIMIAVIFTSDKEAYQFPESQPS
ncbi:MAG TPA: hypothetical protein VGK39_03175 [Cyclobacteriaceae bacterium]